MHSSPVAELVVGARASPLSRAQLEELMLELPHLKLRPLFFETAGDKDLVTSLRQLDKTDFFTREIDLAQLEGKCRLAVHSAKDLPNPLPKGLVLAALTKGVDRADALVMRQGETLEKLPPGAKIATSSEQREVVVRRLRGDLTFVDIRGNIGQRLEQLYSGQVDGVIIAQAALIRLKLTHLNRLILPGPTTPLQGQLAIVARESDHEARALVAPVDVRKVHRILYLGLDPAHHASAYQALLIHYPIIRTSPRPIDVTCIEGVTHLVFTSKTAVSAFVPVIGADRLKSMVTIAVGRITAKHLIAQGIVPQYIADEETAEGVIETLDQLDLSEATVLWPHSVRSRRLIADYLTANQVNFRECIAYDTHLHRPFTPPHLDPFDEIVFTSPSTVDGFLALYKTLPLDKQLTTLGPITSRYLSKFLP